METNLRTLSGGISIGLEWIGKNHLDYWSHHLQVAGVKTRAFCMHCNEQSVKHTP